MSLTHCIVWKNTSLGSIGFLSNEIPIHSPSDKRDNNSVFIRDLSIWVEKWWEVIIWMVNVSCKSIGIWENKKEGVSYHLIWIIGRCPGLYIKKMVGSFFWGILLWILAYFNNAFAFSAFKFFLYRKRITSSTFILNFAWSLLLL